jgi:integrase/recombinase XerD
LCFLDIAYQDFLNDRKSRNTTNINVQNYKFILGGFINYCIESDVLNVEDVESKHIKQYLMYSQRNGKSAGTINTKLQRIRAFFNDLLEEGMVTENETPK